ncbi:MAG: inorganic phosphate transporter [Gemmatimonadota bacterium]|nr:inorganic phosphate transporter [Gemmatimonadota bacterium]MDZ4863819.1 inorganic phosphate transporter [Gemmatimonadota bacterium]
MLVLLLLAIGFLAWSNGANDNFKGVASLFGSGTMGYWAALAWATVTTFAGSIASVFLAVELLKTFSGKGLVPDTLAVSGDYVLAVALGAGLTVILATRLGFPVSTTHALTGAMIGAGWAAVGPAVQLGVLGKLILLPLLLSPLLAMAIGSGIYLATRAGCQQLGITGEWCLCVGAERLLVPISPSAAALAASPPAGSTPTSITTGTIGECTRRYAGQFLGVSAQSVVDAAHITSAGIVSFARGLNDTPKMAALLLVLPALSIPAGMLTIALAIMVGGLLGGRRVAETMSHKLTSLTPGQGLAANLATGMLVLAASLFGLPVSTTHVSVGSIVGVGVTNRSANLAVVRQVLLSWVVTLPCAALAGGAGYWLAGRLQ